MIAGVSPSPLVVNNLGLDFKQDLKTKVSSYGKHQAAALEVMTAAGWKQYQEFKTMKQNLSNFDYNNSSECCLPCSSECKKVEEKINERELADLEKSEIHEILNLFIKRYQFL